MFSFTRIIIIIFIIFIFFLGITFGTERYKNYAAMYLNCPMGAVWNGRPEDIEDLPLDRQRTIQVTSYRPALVRDLSYRKIPLILMQTHQTLQVPIDMAVSIGKNMEKVPEFGYFFMTDDMARRFLSDHLGERYVNAYDSLIPGAYKADLFRYAWLLINGGLYLDTGMVILKSPAKFLSSGLTFCSAEDNDSGGIYNAIIASSPGSPILERALEMCLEHIENRDYTDSDLGITGPKCLARAFEKVMGEKVSAGKDYGSGVQLWSHLNTRPCASGTISNLSGDTICYTKYPTYHRERKWYSTTPSYGSLWKQRKVFKS